MKKLLLLLGLGLLTAAPLLWGSQEPVPEKVENLQDMEEQTRGPVHEAFAAPDSLDPHPGPIVPKKPPAPIEELPPDQKPEGDHVVWIPGYWGWDDEKADFLWISGLWRNLPPEKQWVPGHWTEHDGGSQWLSGYWAPQTVTEVSYVPQPPPTLEKGPSAVAPDTESFYAPGCWVYAQRRFLWRPGFWHRYSPNWIWVPARYVWTPAGCIFVEGRWDYLLARRGLLFTPVRFHRPLWARAGWRFVPRYVIQPEIVLDSLFVRVEFGRYYYGDYYAADYHQHGFVPWMDYRLNKWVPGPLFSHYAWEHRRDVGWERDVRKLYVDRREGIALRPPRTIVEQQRFLKEITEHKMVKVGDRTFKVTDVARATRELHAITPLTKFASPTVKLKTMTREAHLEQTKIVQHYQTLKTERKTAETRIIQNKPPLKPNDSPQLHKLNTPLPNTLRSTTPMMVPGRPTLPAHIEKTVPTYELRKPNKLNPKPFKGK